MQTLDNRLYLELEKIAKQRGITVQQLLRAVVVPEWFRTENPERSREIHRSSARVLRRRGTRRLTSKLVA